MNGPLDYVTSIWHELGILQNCALTTLSEHCGSTAQASLPQALRGPAAIARLAAIDRYERRALSRRKRAIRELDDARSIERAGGDGGDLAGRSQLLQTEQSACVAAAPQAAASSEPERRATNSDGPSANLAERSHRELAERSHRGLAERSQGETFRVESGARHFGRTNPKDTEMAK